MADTPSYVPANVEGLHSASAAAKAELVELLRSSELQECHAVHRKLSLLQQQNACVV